MTTGGIHSHCKSIGRDHGLLLDSNLGGISGGIVGIDGSLVAYTGLKEVERHLDGTGLAVGSGSEEVAVAGTAHHSYVFADFALKSTRPVAVGIEVAEELERLVAFIVLDKVGSHL